MAKKIQQHRGLEKDLPILAEGQIGFTTDTKRIFIGSNAGNVEITNEADLTIIKQRLDEGVKELSQKVNASDKATSAQAQAGTDDNAFMTPLKVSQAIDTLSDTLVNLPTNYLDGLAEASEYPLGTTSFFSNNPTNKFNNFTICGVFTNIYYRFQLVSAGYQIITPYRSNVEGETSYIRFSQYIAPGTPSVWSQWRPLNSASALNKYDTLPSKSDLNEYVEAGVYNTQNDNYVNAPKTTYSAQGTLTVLKGNGGNITQFLIGGNGTGTNTFYFRTKNASSNTWSNWLSVGNVRADGSVPMQNITIGSRKDNSTVGLNSFAQGINVESSGNQSHAEGYETVASGQQSHAEGSSTHASGVNSHAEGSYTKATANNSHAEGSQTTAIGLNSHAEGSQTKASGSGSHAEGELTVAEGYYSHAEGYDTISFGDNSHSEGAWTRATGNSSHAEGFETLAEGDFSHAEGNASKTIGESSHAEGYGTIASGNCSHAEGNNTTAKDYASHSQGQYNKAMSGNATTYQTANTAFVIGNGSSSTALSNAFRVMFNGSTYGLSAFNSTGADYAEFFEWLDGNLENEDRVGYVVALDGEKIRLANEGDEILGVISANPSVIGDSYQDDWQGRYELDKWGRKIIEEYEYEETVVEKEEYEEVYTEIVTEYVEEEQIETYLDDEGVEQQNIIKVEVPVEREVTRTEILTIPKKIKVIRKGTRFKENPEWNNESEYIPREQRKEWDAVGLIGKLLVRTDGTLQVNGFAKVGSNGALTHSDEKTNIQVMSIIGDDIARVFIK